MNDYVYVVPCPICDSWRTKYVGYTAGKDLYHCLNCEEIFTPGEYEELPPARRRRIRPDEDE